MARRGGMLIVLALLGVLLAGAPAHAQEAVRLDEESLASPRVPPISFYWQLMSSGNAQQRAIQRCSRPLSLATDNPQSPAVTTFPLYMTLFPIGHHPITQLVLEGPELGFFEWDADLPLGTNFSIGMTDAASEPTSGGTVDGFYITEGFDNCTYSRPPSSSPISLTINPTDRPCDEIDLGIKGGKQPYTVSVLSGLSGLYANLTGVETDKVPLRNAVPSGQKFNIFITDSAGLTSNVSQTMTSALNAGDCNRPTVQKGDYSPPLGAIIGGAVGGVVAAILLALLAWWLLRRRSAKANERYQERERATKGEFRMADGTVPLVQPFVVTQHSEDYPESTSPTSVHPSLSPHDYPYGPNAIPHQVDYSTSASSPTSPSSQHNHYASYGDESTYQPSYEPTAASSGVELASPEEFAYRDAGTWVAAGQPSSRTPSLPPGAQRPI